MGDNKVNTAIDRAKEPADLLYWCGKDVTKMTRDELEAALRHSCVLYDNLLRERRERGEFTTDLMRALAARL